MRAVCRHFGACGGCSFQDLSPGDYRALKRAGVTEPLARHGIDVFVAPLAETVRGTRRRTTLKATKNGDSVALGFHAARSHAIVDMEECHILTPALLALVPDLRALLHRLLREGEEAAIGLTETQSGIDLMLSLPRTYGFDTALFAQWANRLNLARITVNGELAVQLSVPTVRLGEADVVLPAASFLQPSREGERILQRFVMDAAKGARRIADLFSGCGTFALILAKSSAVHAVDSDTSALQALRDAARSMKGIKPVTIEIRDLFKRPLRPEELNDFEAVIIDPPRAGALAQTRMIAQSRVDRIVYVSCNPESFARDAAILIEAGFRLEDVQPVDQFLWSKHIELVGRFEKRPEWSRRRKD